MEFSCKIIWSNLLIFCDLKGLHLPNKIDVWCRFLTFQDKCSSWIIHHYIIDIIIPISWNMKNMLILKRESWYFKELVKSKIWLRKFEITFKAVMSFPQPYLVSDWRHHIFLHPNENFHNATLAYMLLYCAQGGKFYPQGSLRILVKNCSFLVKVS